MDTWSDWFEQEKGTQQEDVEFFGHSSSKEENFNESDIVDIVM